MTADTLRFDRFTLDPADRLLRRDGEPVEISSRYLDALALLAGERGRLVHKNRFLEEVWRGVPVTDEALTQCIRTLRKTLGDDAARPRFIETVPKHGYRFVAPVEVADGENAARPANGKAWRERLMLAGAGTIGGGFAGFLGGLVYGFAGALQPLQPGMGGASMMLVLMCLCILVAVTGGAGVALGLAFAGFRSGKLWQLMLGGAAGGLIVGGLVKLLGLDAFNLLLGRSPGDITGGAEGALLGAAVGLGAWLARRISLRRGAPLAGLAGMAAGVVTIALGGTMMGGSLDLLAQSFPGSRLRLDQIGTLFGESGFGPISRLVTGGLEGGLFSACLVSAMILGQRSLGTPGER